MRPRSKSLRRRSPSRDPKPKIIIVSEGRLREPDYFYSLARQCGALVSFDVTIEKGAGVPISVVTKASERLTQLKRLTGFSKNDTVWAVFDRDDHPRFDEAIEIAFAAGVKVAFSNPCFEVWLILHFRDWDRPTDRHSMQRELRKFAPSYDPSGSKLLNFDLIANNVATATKRGRIIEQRRNAERAPRGNPISTVFYLVEHMQKTHEK